MDFAKEFKLLAKKHGFEIGGSSFKEELLSISNSAARADECACGHQRGAEWISGLFDVVGTAEAKSPRPVIARRH